MKHSKSKDWKLAGTIAPIFITTLLTTTSLYSLNAVAQETTQLNKIVVEASSETADGPVDGYVAKRSASGTKTDTPILTTPQSISVVTADQIEDQGADSVAEALRYTPGVYGEYRGTSNLHDEVFIRGFQYATKFLNNMKFGGSSLGQLDPFLLERVEVVKGPNSVLYGQIMPGGMINQILKTPTGETHKEVSISYGSDNFKEINADFEGQLNEANTLQYRIVGTLWDKELQGDDLSQNRILFAPTIKWDITDKTELTVEAIYQDEPEAGYRGFIPFKGTFAPTSAGYTTPRDLITVSPAFDGVDRTTVSLGYEFKHEFENELKLSHKLRANKIDQAHQAVLLDWMDADGHNIHLGAIRAIENMEQLTSDTSLEKTFRFGAMEHKLFVGVDTIHSTSYQTYEYNWSTGLTYDLANPQFVDGNTVTLATRYKRDKEISQVGVYFQDQIKYENLNIVFGGRHDWANTDVVDLTGANSTETYNDEAFTGRVGASYEFDNGFVPYASYSTSFEPVTDLDPNGKATFDPTTGKQVEVGVKWQASDKKTLITASYYNIEQENLLEWDSGIGGYVPIGSIKAKGYELELKAEVFENLNILASYSHVDSKITTGANAGYESHRFPGTTASFWAKYDVGLGLDVAFGVRYYGDAYGNDDNTIKLPNYVLLDLAVGLDLEQIQPQLKGMKAKLNVSNLTDKTYLSSCAYGNYCWYGAGRTIKASLNYEW